MSEINNVHCSHLSMTRFYSSRARCFSCRKHGSFGWLYRCTQDRELLLEEDSERIRPEWTMDKLPSIFPGVISRTRGPAARTAGSASFFEETSQEDLETYSEEQINIILDQRSRLLDRVTDHEYVMKEECRQVKQPFRPSPVPDSSASQLNIDRQLKKWWPPMYECQFKCCPACRPSFAERAFLSIDGILNGDLPNTAVVGFGFGPKHGRSVSLVKHVRNLGMRQNPLPSRVSHHARDGDAETAVHQASRSALHGLGIDVEPDDEDF